jgi:hypothetical protein
VRRPVVREVIWDLSFLKFNIKNINCVIKFASMDLNGKKK